MVTAPLTWRACVQALTPEAARLLDTLDALHPLAQLALPHDATLHEAYLTWVVVGFNSGLLTRDELATVVQNPPLP